MSTTHHMKMAKASQADIDAAIELYQFLQAASNGRGADEVVDEFGYKGYDDLLESKSTDVEFVLRAHERGGLFRIVWGMQVLLDPANEVVDPNLPHLELHPKHEQAQREIEELNKAKNALIDERDALLRIINESFMHLHIPASTMAFDGRNLTPHAEEAGRAAMVLRAERDEARAELLAVQTKPQSKGGA